MLSKALEEASVCQEFYNYKYVKEKSCSKTMHPWTLAASAWSLEEDSGLSKSWDMEESEAKFWLLFPINLDRKQRFLSSPLWLPNVMIEEGKEEGQLLALQIAGFRAQSWW